jgi:hypothetical protein
MKRIAKCTSHSPAYPHIRAFLKRYGRRAGAGLVAGVVASTAGCDWLEGGILAPKPEVDTGEHLDGMIGETAETYSIQLPLDGAHDLYFADPWGWIQYRVAVVLDGTQLYDWLYQNADTALAIIDAVLAEEPVTTYEIDDGYGPVEDRIVTALMQAYQSATGNSGGSFLSVELAILAYEDEDDILGDMEAAR